MFHRNNRREMVSFIQAAKFCLVSLSINFDRYVTTNMSETSPAANVILDPKRRKDIVDEAFLEQKDVLLDMLEVKLKEMRDKKKLNKTDKNFKCQNGDCKETRQDLKIKLKSSGIVGFGRSDLTLLAHKPGKTSLNLNASGISNVGEARIELGVDNVNFCIPGIEHLFGNCSNRTPAIENIHLNKELITKGITEANNFSEIISMQTSVGVDSKINGDDSSTASQNRNESPTSPAY